MGVRFLVVLATMVAAWGAATSYGWPPTWGAELTFTNRRVSQAEHGETGMWPYAEENQAALERFYAHAKRRLKKDPAVRDVDYLVGHDKWGHDIVRVSYTDGWHFDVTLDPYCLEVIPKPFTLDELKKQYAVRLDSDVFALMKEVGLRPRRRFGGGHLHMGAESTFGDDVLFFRNFLADQMNHPEIALGGFERDAANAKSFSRMNRRQKAAFAALLESADAGDYRTPRRLASDFVAKVLFEGKPATGRRIMDAKYWEMNLLRFADLDTWNTLEPNERWSDYEAWVLYDDVPKKARTVELRALRAQRNAADLILDIELAETRLRRLKAIPKPIALDPRFFSEERMTAIEGAERLYYFLLENGVAPSAYAHHLPRRKDKIPNGREWRQTFEALCAAAVVAH